MMHQLKNPLSVVFSLAGVLSLPLMVSTAAAERDYEHQERRSSARVSERDLRSFEDYLNSHDETAQLLYQNPDLINDRQFVRRHDALHDWLEDHQEAAATIQANPQKFLWRERSVGPSDFLRQLLK